MPSIVVLGLVAAAALPGLSSAQQLRVVVVPGLETGDLAALTDRGAVGLLVPDAGPETSGARARAALERGAVRNSILGGLPEGQAVLEVETSSTIPAGPAIVLGLPEGGEQPNDRRYPIAVVGGDYAGVLTSDSTRIPGLVSIVDVAPTVLGEDGALGSRGDDDPLGTLRDLDLRIDANRDAKTVVLLLSLALIVAVAAFLPAGVLPAFAAVLLANLALGVVGATEVWAHALVVVLAVASSLLLARTGPVSHGVLMAATLAAYLVAMAADERWVALSPLGPTQNARFYGLSNLLATLLLVPALAGAVLLGRRFGMWAFVGVAALSLVTVGGSSFGADGGGAVVLLVAFLVLAALEHRFDRRLAVGGAVVAAVLALALALGGSSHVTDALSDGPVGLLEDLGRRIQLSFERATAGWGVALLVFGGIAALAVLALRERRPVQLSLLAAIGVSLVVNDSPNDVVVAGLACYLVLSSAPELARPAREPGHPAPRERPARTAQAASP
ncbi:MAG TPA: hypothetical protein VF236_05075 [Gaiellaceae bacterium]